MIKNKMSSNHARIILMGLLAIPLLAVIGATMIISDQHTANAQLSTAQQNAAKSLVATGYTNHYPLNPPRTWCSSCSNVTVTI